MEKGYKAAETKVGDGFPTAKKVPTIKTLKVVSGKT